ncbi:MAG: VanZ family protein [Gammaproteobacteria bacterium]|jgi:hypothetical protein
MKKLYRAIFFTTLITVFYFSLVPSFDIPNIAALSFISDKVIHLGIFFFISYIGLNCSFTYSNIFLLCLIFAFGLIIEIIHFYHPYRFFEVADLIANLTGILLAQFFFNKKQFRY